MTPRSIYAEAARRVTRLHGPHHDERMDAELKRWLEADARHLQAFKVASDAWAMSDVYAGFTLPPRPEVAAPVPGRRRRDTLAIAALACCLMFIAVHFLLDPSASTGPGEQRTLTLKDGTVVTLNANSRLEVQYDDQVRRVLLTAGEAYFNVIKHERRPFDVVIGDRKVVALGTSFQVRREDPARNAFAVTLIEGRVAIEPLSQPDTVPPMPLPAVQLLTAGQRLTIGKDAEVVDAPSIAKVTAWRHGQIVFEDAALSEAASEFNRYGKERITLDDPAIGRIRVGGVYRLGDPAAFAHVVAAAHHLTVSHRDHDISLAAAPPATP